MEANSNKEISVVLTINNVTALNDQLINYPNGQQKVDYIKQFFLNKYGQGEGLLNIVHKNNKVKLVWRVLKYNYEAEKFHKNALSKAKVKDFQVANKNWIKAIALNPFDPDYYFNLGIVFFELKNYKEAIENLNRTLKLCPIYYKAHLILGTVYLKTRKFDKAEEHLKESIIFYPKHPLAYLNLGAVYSILKRYTEGIEMFNRTIELSSNEVRAHFGLAKIYSFTGDLNKANLFYKNVININTNPQLTNHAKRAMFSSSTSTTSMQIPINTENIDKINLEKYYQEGYSSYLYTDYDKAIKMYSVYLSVKKDDDFVWYSLGEACLRNGMAEKAVESFKMAINLNQSKGSYYKGLSLAFYYLDKYDQVIEAIEKAEKFDKDDSISNTICGDAFLQKEKYREAIKKFEKALKLNTNNLLAKKKIALAYIKMNQADVAINFLYEIIRAPSNSPLKMEAEILLKKFSK